MPCSICKQCGHNSRTCPQKIILKQYNNNNLNNINIIKPKPISSAVSNDNVTSKKTITCVICLDEITDQPRTELSCSHTFCTKCIMTNMSKGDTKCPMCRDVIMEPNTEIQDLKQQITSLQELNSENRHHTREITRLLLRLNINSTIELSRFINRYRIERRVLQENFEGMGMSLMEFVRANSTPQRAPRLTAPRMDLVTDPPEEGEIINQ